MKRRRVKITGIGPITPAGIGREIFSRGIAEPVTRVTGLRIPDATTGTWPGACIRDFDPRKYLCEFAEEPWPRSTQLAVAAAILAVEDAGLTLDEIRRLQPVVSCGAAWTDFSNSPRAIDLLTKPGPMAGLLNSLFGAAATGIGQWVGENARLVPLGGALCSGLDAIAQGGELIARGDAEVALCGGGEAPLYFHPLHELTAAGLAPGAIDCPEQICRPFDLWRTTGVIAEGACIVVLEPDQSSRRGYAYVDGYAHSTDRTEQAGEAWAEAMLLALANGKTRPGEIECIHAFGTGQASWDTAEATALRKIFNANLGAIPALSIKGAIGHALGAASAIQVGSAAISLRDSVIPPTVNWRHADPACPLNLSSKTRLLPMAKTLINAHGLSGTNSCLLLKR